MLIWPTSLLVQESQGITTSLRGHEPDLARSAQMVNREKDLVPGEVGTTTHHIFEVARMCLKHHVDHLISRGDLSSHVTPLEEWSELLRS